MRDVGAGWFLDPHEPNQVRYWDGGQWTHHVHPIRGDDIASAGDSWPDSSLESPRHDGGYEAPPEGWYLDPKDSALQRYWDGVQWTEWRRPTQLALKTPKQQAANQVKEVKAAQRANQRAERRANRDQVREQKAQNRADRQAAELELAGEMVADEMFGFKTIKIYQKCYVRVGLLATSKAPLERLISIEASSDVQKKTGIGRGAAAVVTAGYSLASSNKRGDVYLIIVTDRKTYALHEDPPTAGNLRVSKTLEAAGKAAILASTDIYHSWETSPAEDEDSRPERADDGGLSAPDRLRRLKSLHEEGLLTDEEFTELKGRVLDSL